MDLNYRQGMNDLVAIMVYNCIKETPPPGFKPSNKTEELYCYVLNEKHWEADIYMMFDKMMKTGHKEMYELDKNRIPWKKQVKLEKRNISRN